MNENENVGFDEFENALFGDDYQYDDESGSDEVETDGAGDDNADDSAEDVVSEENDTESDEYESSDDEEKSDEEEATEKSDNTDAGQTFTLKVNKEEKQVTLEEMTALAQKGADYDRVKENYSKSQQTIQDLQSKLETANKYQGALDILEAVSTKTNVKLEDLAEMLYLSVRKGAGASEGAAREELKNAKLEKELNSFKAQKAEPKQKVETAEVRAQRELEEFRGNYPDVNLTDELISKLSPDLRNGVSLSAAYRSYEREQSNARIKDLEQKLAAKQKNEKNKTSSPGSQKDSGGRRSRSDYEEFERALFG